jgi:hypothetical protein
MTPEEESEVLEAARFINYFGYALAIIGLISIGIFLARTFL